MSFVFRTVFAFLCVTICVFGAEERHATARDYSDIRGTVEALFRKVESLQVKRDVPFIPPMFWEKHKGMWESDVKFYFHGHEDMFLLREAFAVYDDNMFGTAWITSCLLEGYRYGNMSKPSDDMILASVLAIREYHNKNLEHANSLMTFWPQRYNETEKAWNSYPVNLHNFFDLAAAVNFTTFERILEEIGLTEVAEIMIRLLRTEHGYLHAFLIPPDFDDTFVNLGLGSLLSEVKSEFPASHAQWKAQNTNVTSVFDALKKYAYRPMSNDSAVNTIDPRTYFYIRYFLEEAEQRGENISLVPTWIQDLDEVRTWRNRGVDMPFNINNVDVTVAANAVFGTTAGVLNGLVDVEVLDDPEIQHVYLNTTNLIASMIRTNFSSRHDLALLYYPSEIEFYWFVARTYGELLRSANKGPLPHPILEKVMTVLDEVLHDHMTSTVLNQTRADTDGNLYIDDFVGDGDLDRNNNTVVRGQDRLFTTGMAINALLSTWTTFDDESGKLYWQKDTPRDVKDAVMKAANFVNKNVFSLSYQPWNAFFSGSVKGSTTRTNYPVNREESKEMYLRGVEGVMSEAEYKAELIKDHSPIDFHGYNGYDDYWPFWCSEPYTYVTTMLALAKFSNTYEPSE